jgi:membrane protease YdiL (CAAX protease family)
MVHSHYCTHFDGGLILKSDVQPGGALMHPCPQCSRVLATADGLRVHQSMSHAPRAVEVAEPASVVAGMPRPMPAHGARDWASAPPPAASDRVWAAPPVPPRASRGGLATRTVVGIIVANLVLQGMVLAITLSSHLRPRAALVLSLVMGLLFYGATVTYVTVRAGELNVRATWLHGSASKAAALGLLAGAGAAAGLSIVMWAAVGHAVVDPMAGLLSGESFGPLLLGIVVIAGVGPLVEELVFRGFLAEAFRDRGPGAAIVLSAAAFSLAHLRFAQFRYYLLMGIAFGVIYWRRGLVGSIATHAAFNGTLIVVAIIAAHGPATVVHADGLALRLPASWHQAHASKGAVDVAALGPGDAQLEVTHRDLPPGANFNLDSMAAALESGRLNLPGGTFDPASVRIINLPVASAVRLDAEVGGHSEEAVLLVVGDRFVVIQCATNGSSQASRDFESLLTSLQLG